MVVIDYTDDISCINAENIPEGFFQGRLRKPNIEKHLNILCNSYKVWLAIDRFGFEYSESFVNGRLGMVIIDYTDDISCINAENIPEGFFQGWLSKPNIEKHLDILCNSYKVWLAIDRETNKVVGFINAISDGILSAYIPLLEVLPKYQKMGIGGELVKRMLDSLKDLYMADLLCDPELQPYYQKFGMTKSTGMIMRNYDRQGVKP